MKRNDLQPNLFMFQSEASLWDAPRFTYNPKSKI